MSRMNEIAYVCGLDVVETTTGRNGYPQNIKQAIVGFDEWEYAESVAERYGLRITTLHKRDGWQLWERNGDTTLEPLKPEASWYGDNYHAYEGDDVQSWYEDAVKPFLEDIDSWDGLHDFVRHAHKTYEAIHCAYDTELVITHENSYYDTISKECLSWSHDTHHYVIALMED